MVGGDIDVDWRVVAALEGVFEVEGETWSGIHL
jgi:hypothetical protein